MLGRLLLVTVVQITLVSNSEAINLIWHDEFDGHQGTRPNPNHWKFDIGSNGWGNEEKQDYTDNPANAGLDGHGNLQITALRDHHNRYTSARMVTEGRFAPKFGRIEARMKLPHGKGVWPAFWLLGNDVGSRKWPECGEIDIMEMRGSSPNTVSGALHGPGYSGGSCLHHSHSLPHGQSFSNDFHVFAIEWFHDKITWSIDGHHYMTKTPNDLHNGPWVFNNKFFIILNLAIGGNYDGDPDGNTAFPQVMLVDYIRVYEQNLREHSKRAVL